MNLDATQQVNIRYKLYLEPLLSFAKLDYSTIKQIVKEARLSP